MFFTDILISSEATVKPESHSLYPRQRGVIFLNQGKAGCGHVLFLSVGEQLPVSFVFSRVFK